MQVGVAAALDQPAAAARPARTLGRLPPCTAARPPGRARASSCRPRRARRGGRRGAPARGSWPPPPRGRPAVPASGPRSSPRSDGFGRCRRLARRAALRRRFGRVGIGRGGVAAVAGFRVARGLAGALSAAVALDAVLRVARGLAGALASAGSDAPSDATSETSDTSAVAFAADGLRVARGLRAGAAVTASSAASAVDVDHRRSPAARRRSASRAAMPASARPGPGASPRAPAGRRSTARSSERARRCCRSLDPATPAIVARRRRRLRVRPLTSGIAVDPATATGRRRSARAPWPTGRPTGRRGHHARRHRHRPAAAGTAALLGDQVLRDLRLVEVLVVRDGRPRGGARRGRRAELRVPDRAERRRSRCARRGDVEVVLLAGRPRRRRSARRRGGAGGRSEDRRGAVLGLLGLALVGSTSATAATATTAPASAPRLVAVLRSGESSPFSGLGRDRARPRRGRRG